MTKFESASGLLILVSLPIGNDGDLTARAAQALKSSDLVAAEDTRSAGRLLKEIGAAVPTISCFEGNETDRIDKVLAALQSGKTVALISEAGTPGISDPGYPVLRAAIEAGVEVDAVPGPCAAILALTLSGLPTDRFCFEGFLPRKGQVREDRLNRIAAFSGSVIIYESALRIHQTIDDLARIAGDSPAALCREMTKQHQEILRGSLVELADRLRGQKVLGEVVLVVHCRAGESDVEEGVRAAKKLKREMDLSDRDAARAAAICTGGSKSEIYNRLIRDKNREETQ